MANGFGEAFGSAYARSLQMTREEEERQREKDRRQALLLQLVGAPIASGITKGVAALIQEPFNEPVTNFFNSERGKQINLQDKQHQTYLNTFTESDKKVKASGKSATAYEGERILNAFKSQVDPFFKETYGADFEKKGSYVSLIAEAENRIYGDSGLAATEVAQREKARQDAERAKTSAERKKIYKKYNPYASNPFQAAGRLVGRIFRRESFDDYEARRVDQIARAAGFKGTNATTGADVDLNKMFIESMQKGYKLDDDQIISLAEELLDKRYNVTNTPSGKVYQGLTEAAELDLIARQARLNNQKLYSRGVRPNNGFNDIQQEAYTLAKQASSEAQRGGGEVDAQIYDLKLKELAGDIAKDPNAQELKQKEDLFVDQFVAERKARYVIKRVTEDESTSVFGNPPTSSDAALTAKQAAEKEFDIAFESAYQIALESTRNEYWANTKITDSTKQSPMYKDIISGVTKEERRLRFLQEVNKRHQYIIENHIKDFAIIEGQSGKSAEEKQRTILTIQQKAAEASTDYKPKAKTPTPVAGTPYIFAPSSNSKHAPRLKSKNWNKLIEQYRAGGDPKVLSQRLTELEEQFVKNEDASDPNNSYIYDPDQFDYSGFPDWQNLKRGLPYKKATSTSPTSSKKGRNKTTAKVDKDDDPVPYFSSIKAVLDDLVEYGADAQSGTSLEEDQLLRKEKEIERRSGSILSNKYPVIAASNIARRASAGNLTEDERKSLLAKPLTDQEMDEMDRQYAQQVMDEKARELASTFTKVRGFKSDKATLDKIKTALQKSKESDAFISLVLSYLEGTEYGSAIEA